jgi:hypothetical protein
LDIPADVRSATPIHCSSCKQFIGYWGELNRDFDSQGQDGVFEMKDEQILRKP